MKKQELVSKLSILFKRDFNPRETMQWLTINKPMYWSWGVSKVIALGDKGLLLRVHGHHHDGYVLITLDWNDTYEVHIVKTNATVLSSHNDIYCDMLQEFVDEKIEKIKEYVR